MPAELATSLTASEPDRLMQAEAMVRAYCGWHIAPVRQETWTLDSSGARVLTLPTLRLKAVASLRDGDTLVDPGAYSWSEDGLLTRLSSSLWDWELTRYSFTREPYWDRSGFRRIELDVEHGFDTVPWDISAVVQAMAVRGMANPGSLIREQVGPFAYSYSGSSSTEVLPLSILTAERTVLDRYKLPSRP